MRLKPFDFFVLVYAAIRDRRLERELDDEVWAEWVADGTANPDGTINYAALNADSIPFEEVLRPYPDLHREWLESEPHAEEDLEP